MSEASAGIFVWSTGSLDDSIQGKVILLALSLKHLVTTDVRLFELGAEIVW